MKQHANATLTVAKRKQVKQLFENQQLSIAELARRFSVHRDTIRKWIHRDSPFDNPSAERKKRVITAEYEQAVIEYRRANPHRGAIRIALALQSVFLFANRGTVMMILKKHGLTKKGKTRPKTKWKIPVGRHRLQCDIQELPAVKGNKGFEYTHQLYSFANTLLNIQKFMPIARPKRLPEPTGARWIIYPLFHNFHR
jgi:transposase-like protein